jgi:hypothetical protein
VANLSKFYDQDMLNPGHVNSLHLKETHSNRDNQDVVRESTQRKDFNKPENPDKPFFNGINRKKTSAGENGLEGYRPPINTGVGTTKSLKTCNIKFISQIH